MRLPRAISPVPGVRCSPDAASGLTPEGFCWTVHWKAGGKRREHTLGRCSDAQDASGRAKRLLKTGALGFTTENPTRNPLVPRMRDVFTAGEVDLAADRGVTASTKRAYGYALRHLRLGLDDLEIGRLARDTLRAYLDERTKAGGSSSTLLVELALLHRCWRAYHGATPPVLPVVSVRHEAARDVACPDPAQVRAVLAWVLENETRKWCYVALVLCWGTGARSEEVAHLTWSAVDLKKGSLKLSGKHGGKTGGRSLTTNPASPWWQVLQAWKQTSTGASVLGVVPRTMQSKLTDEVLPTACEALGIPRFTLHSIRHSAVTAFCSTNHANAAEIKARFGHSIKTAMERYVKPSPADLATKADLAGLGAL